MSGDDGLDDVLCAEKTAAVSGSIPYAREESFIALHFFLFFPSRRQSQMAEHSEHTYTPKPDPYNATHTAGQAASRPGATQIPKFKPSHNPLHGIKGPWQFVFGVAAAAFPFFMFSYSMSDSMGGGFLPQRPKPGDLERYHEQRKFEREERERQQQRLRDIGRLQVPTTKGYGMKSKEERDEIKKQRRQEEIDSMTPEELERLDRYRAAMDRRRTSSDF